MVVFVVYTGKELPVYETVYQAMAAVIEKLSRMVMKLLKQILSAPFILFIRAYQLVVSPGWDPNAGSRLHALNIACRRSGNMVL
jgi:hypothetical protein